MQRQIEETLQQLVGLPLWASDRAADLQMFQFGRRRLVPSVKGGNKTVGEFALHVQCAWRISGPDGIVVGSSDVYYPQGDPFQEPPGFEWDAFGANRRDELIEGWLLKHQDVPLIVATVRADAVGGAVIELSEEFTLALFPHDTVSVEFWRLFVPGVSKVPHFVVSRAGITLV